MYAATRDPASEKYVVHDCSGVGWGNSIRGLVTSASLAAILGRRLIIEYKAFNRMFNPPNKKAKYWDFGVEKALRKQNINPYDVTGQFDYEKYGRQPGSFGKWIDGLKKDMSKDEYYKAQILKGGMCAGELQFVTTGDCVTKAFPLYGKCVSRMIYNVIGMPFFHSLFRRPSSKMVKALANIRTRLGLPMLANGTEPAPGAWGLRTPGYYIFAMHWRQVPLGFEPSAFEVQEWNKKQGDSKGTLLKSYLKVAKNFAQEAKELAECRGEKLLIYFATDDVMRLRPVITEQFSKYGEVIFGLTPDEVGHMIGGQWRQSEIEKLEEAKKEVVLAEAEVSAVDGAIIPKSGVVHVEKSPEAEEMYANMAMVEWWILANSHWLLSHIGTSYSETAATFGLGPRGVMERFDFAGGGDYTSTEHRIDWSGKNCKPMGAADKEQAKKCPNIKD